MKTVTLSIRYSPHALRPAQAGYIAGADPAAWLDEFAAWNVPLAAVRLYPVPRSATDRRPCGALVTCGDQLPADAFKRCVGFGKIADRLFLPVDARLEPDVSDAELQSLLSADYTYVWHPTSGLVAFEPADVLAVSDLLKIGAASPCRWDRARPGITISQRLVSLLPEKPPTVEMILEEGQDDIGSEETPLSELPPSPLEPETGIVETPSRHAKRLLAKIVHWFTDRVPATSQAPTWVNKLEEWADKHLSGFLAGFEAARHREIVRLMHLLQSDPDRGLRFALPIGGDPYRGRAPRSNRLSERNVNFNLGRLGGGRPADFWDVPAHYRHQLMARYRELANREMQLGRHRRAAYIFAELLGDLNAAAGALADGRHWREAAVVYQQRLNRPMEAARCLQRGGLWAEAIALYEELAEYENAGDLCLQLGQVERAHEQFRAAVARHRSNGDLLSSARLLETKLAAVDEAIDELSSGWPDSPQATQCLRGVFRLLGQLGRHEFTRLWITGFRQQLLPERNRAELVEILADTATAYPDRGVRQQAADCTLALVSRQLPGASKPACAKLLSAVSRLVPGDHLLRRDCQRYAAAEPAGSAAPSPMSLPRRKIPSLVRTIQLPGKDVNWKTAVACGKSIFVAGQLDHQLVLTRCSWIEADRPGKAWSIEPHASDAEIILAAAPRDDDFLLIHVIGNATLTTEHVFPPSDQCPKATKAGALRGMPAAVLAAARTLHGITWFLSVQQGGPTLVAIGPQGQQLSTHSVSIAHAGSVLPIPLHARGDKVYLGAGNRLVKFDKAKPPEATDFAQQITSLAGSAPHSRPRIAVTFEQGGAVIWDDFESGPAHPFGQDVTSPVACFNRGGYLIAAGDGCCEVYSMHGRRLQLISQIDDKRLKPIAVLSGPRSDQFGIVSDTGQIAVYEA